MIGFVFGLALGAAGMWGFQLLWPDRPDPALYGPYKEDMVPCVVEGAVLDVPALGVVTITAYRARQRQDGGTLIAQMIRYTDSMGAKRSTHNVAAFLNAKPVKPDDVTIRVDFSRPPKAEEGA